MTPWFRKWNNDPRRLRSLASFSFSTRRSLRNTTRMPAPAVQLENMCVEGAHLEPTDTVEN